MNTVVSLDQLPQDVVVVRVSDADMESMQSMACSDDPVVRAAIDSICRATDAGAITLDSKNTVAPSVFDELVHQHWRAAAMQVLSHKYRFGFMPYIRVNVERDCGKDEWWVKKNAEWVKKNPGKTVRAFSVPVIPAFGTYEVYVYNDELMQTRVLCLPRDTGDTKAYPIQTIVFDEIYLPRITVVHPRVARLQSTVATLGRSYLSTCLAREIHMNAAVARANPVVFLQHDMKSIGVEDATYEREYVDSTSSDPADVKRYKVTDFAGERLSVDSTAKLGEQQGALGKRSPPVFLLPQKIVVATQPRQAETTGDMERVSSDHVISVSQAFGIPLSQITSVGSSKVANPEDRPNFVRVVLAEQACIVETLNGIFAKLNEGSRARFSLPSDIVTNTPDVLFELFDRGAITVAQLRDGVVVKQKR